MPREVDIQAAGAVCWHERNDELYVLLVHRPRYDDWSWPKGKLNHNETAPAAAAREVFEETGLHIALGIPLPSMRYTLTEGQRKEVKMWAAHVPAKKLPPVPRPHEVDAMQWVKATAAAKQLTRRSDRLQLDALVTAHLAGNLHCKTLVLVRTAHSYPSRSWSEKPADRPLLQVGMLQAKYLSSMLTCWPPKKIFSSPYSRSVDTLSAFAKKAQKKIKTKAKLTGKQQRKHPHKIADFAVQLLIKQSSFSVCTDASPAAKMLQVWATHGTKNPDFRRFMNGLELDPGEIFVAHVSHQSGEIVAIEAHKTPTSKRRE